MALIRMDLSFVESVGNVFYSLPHDHLAAGYLLEDKGCSLQVGGHFEGVRVGDSYSHWEVGFFLHAKRRLISEKMQLEVLL
jgi:hypothetical protein